MKIVIVGAGSAMFTVGVVNDLINAGFATELALVDIDAEALEIAQQLCEKMIRARGASIRLAASTDRRAVLRGATAVITTIGVGGRRAWEQDVFIPRKYGLFLPVGDTVGPSGSSRALRMIPAMLAIARDVMELAPDALFFNYANPMAPICHAVRTIAGAPVIGLCMGTWETARYLAAALGVDMLDLVFNAAGINHLTWFSDLAVKGEDAMPPLRERAARVVEQARAAVEQARRGQAPMPHSGSPFESSLDYPFSWQCLLWFDAFPAPMDRHVTEFFPQLFRDGSYYGKKLGVDEFPFADTIKAGDDIYAEMRAEALSPQPLAEAYFARLGGEQEQVVEIIQAVLANERRFYFANLPNTGQAPGLPPGAVVETWAVTDGRGLHAIQQQPLPGAAAGLLAARFAWVEAIVEAAVRNSRQSFIQALILDGAVQSPDVAVRLADELIAANGLTLA
jgi:alpha-galactosidase